jgi:hypothetical protein
MSPPRDDTRRAFFARGQHGSGVNKRGKKAGDRVLSNPVVWQTAFTGQTFNGEIMGQADWRVD